MPDSSLAILVIDVSVVYSCLWDSHLTDFILEHCVDQALSYVFPSWRMFLVVGACLQHNLVWFCPYFSKEYAVLLQMWIIGSPAHILGSSWSETMSVPQL